MARLRFLPNGHAELISETEIADLYPWQVDLIVAAMCRRCLTCDDLADIIWPGLTIRPDQWRNGLDVRMHRLRKLTRDFGFEISRIGWREGYGLKLEKRNAVVRERPSDEPHTWLAARR